MTKDSDLYIENFPEELRRQAKSLAAARGKTLRQFVIEAVRTAVLRDALRNPRLRKIVRD